MHRVEKHEERRYREEERALVSRDFGNQFGWRTPLQRIERDDRGAVEQSRINVEYGIVEEDGIDVGQAIPRTDAEVLGGPVDQMQNALMRDHHAFRLARRPGSEHD